jgi:hypothetical protein
MISLHDFFRTNCKADEHEHSGRWQEAVRDAVEDYRSGKNREAQERDGRQDTGQRV